MSIKIMSWVWDHSDTKGSERLVLLALADSANDDGICWPGMAYIAKKANLEKRYVLDILKDLESGGHITVRRRREGNFNKSNVYQVITGVVMPASLGSDAQDTRGSEAETPRVVRPASPDPSINRDIDPSIKPNVSVLPPTPPPTVDNQPKEKVGKPRKSSADPRTSHPAIQSVFEIVGRFPKKEEYDALIMVLGDKPDKPKLRACWAEWRRDGPDKKPYSPFNFGWIMDWYINGIPDHSKKNGSKPTNPHGAMTLEERAAQTGEDLEKLKKAQVKF